jgi:hypothetical protein
VKSNLNEVSVGFAVLGHSMAEFDRRVSVKMKLMENPARSANSLVQSVGLQPSTFAEFGGNATMEA